MNNFNVNPNSVAGPQNAYPDAPAATPDPEACDEGVISREDLLLVAGTASSITVDGQQTVNRPINDLIALDKHLSNRRSACSTGGNGWGAVGKSKVVPPSATGDV